MGNPGARSRKKTRRWVLIADKIADKAITIGGVLVIAAVMTMTVYLIYVVVPLFKGGEVLSVKQYNAPIDPSDIVNLTLDEHGTLAVAVSKTGKVDIWHAGTGTPLKSLYFDFGAKKLTSVGKTIDNNSIAFGFSDGTLRLAEIVFRNDIISEDSAPQGSGDLMIRIRPTVTQSSQKSQVRV